MSRIGRNDPCPCGSGKKYKKCCLLKEEEAAASESEEMAAVQCALRWLHENHRDETADAVQNIFFGAFDDDERAAAYEAFDEDNDLLVINIGEWLVTDAKIRIGEMKTPTQELFLGPDGPLFTAAGRNWLQRLGANPLSLYEARSVTLGEEMELTDLLHPGQPPVRVVEKTATRTIVRGEVFGARIVERRGGTVLSGALYPFVREDGLSCRDDILRVLRKVRRDKLDPAHDREIISLAIITHWLDHLVQERPLPKMLDSETQEPLLLVTDHYHVADWDLLDKRLAVQPDVDGNRNNGWVRFEEAAGEFCRSRAALNVKPPDSLEVFCRTRTLAEESRAWLEKLAGDAIVFRARAVTDPTSPKALEEACRAPKPAQPDVPPEELARALRNFLRKHYANWADEPIPALGNKTPRQAMKTARGRKAVIELLKDYEHQEACKVRNEGGEPFDFTFLWEKLGLKRSEGC